MSLCVTISNAYKNAYLMGIFIKLNNIILYNFGIMFYNQKLVGGESRVASASVRTSAKRILDRERGAGADTEAAARRSTQEICRADRPSLLGSRGSSCGRGSGR